MMEQNPETEQNDDLDLLIVTLKNPRGPSLAV